MSQGVLRWDIPGYLNNTPGTWELVINVEKTKLFIFYLTQNKEVKHGVYY